MTAAEDLRGNARLNPAGNYECRVCGATEAPPVLPCPLAEFTGSLQRFVDAHRACQPGPRRVQLSRAAGWRMPENTVKVDRSTPWGNPFIPNGPPANLTLYECLAKFERHAMTLDLEPLRGKNLACWCKPSAPCHADILLQLANSKDSQR
jgi:hypothetical protein